MKRTILAGIVVTSFFFQGIAGYAETKKVEVGNPEKSYKKMGTLLDKLEEKHPKDQADLFTLRTLANSLYQQALQAVNMGFSGAALSKGSRRALTRDADGASTLYAGCQGLKNEELKDELYQLMCNQVPVGYQGAQDIVFTQIDNHDGRVQCVYTGKEITTHSEPDATIMNIEHTWPQSQGAVGDAKCDLHHLFPTDSKTNNLRSSYPFGNVEKPTWEMAGSKFNGKKFEVRKQHRGNVARAMFYFAIRYQKAIDPAQEEALRQWSDEDPVDEAERERNNEIQNLQHNRNAFIDRPEFIKLIKDF